MNKQETMKPEDMLLPDGPLMRLLLEDFVKDDGEQDEE